MLRSIGAVVAGFVTMAVLVMGGTFAWVAAKVPGGMAAMRQNPDAAAMQPSTAYLAFNLVLSLVAAFAGGWVTTRIAQRSATAHLAALAAVVVVMGIVSSLGPGSSRQPGWYKFVIPLVGLAGVALSAFLAPTRA
jgi:hypothetical protein